MSLKITNKATPKQTALLQKLEYVGTGQFAANELTTDEAGKIIDELFRERGYTYGEMIFVADGYYDYPGNYLESIDQLKEGT